MTARSPLFAACMATTVLAGCAPLNLHQRDQYESAKTLVETVRVATDDSDSIWSAMESNLKAFEPAERAAIERAVADVQRTNKRRIYVMDWATLRDEVVEQAEDDDWLGQMEVTRDLIMGLKSRIEKLQTQIKEEAVGPLVGASPTAGGREGSEEPDVDDSLSKVSELLDDAGSSMEGMNLENLDLPGDINLASLSEVKEEIEKAIEAGKSLVERVGGIQKGIADLQEALDLAASEGWPIDKLLEILRNAEDLELVQDLIDVEAEFGDSAHVSGAVSKAMDLLQGEAAEKAIRSFQDLKDALSKEDVKGELIRRRLQRDLSTSRAESLQVDLTYLQDRTDLLKSRLELLQERMQTTAGIVTFVNEQLGDIDLMTDSGKRKATGEDNVFVVIRHLIDSQRAGLSSLASVEGDGMAQLRGYNQSLKSCVEALQAAAGYVRLENELSIRSSLIQIAEARALHLHSIRRSRVAARTWDRLLLGGAEGLEAYWAGGVKPEDLATLALLVADVTATSIEINN